MSKTLDMVFTDAAAKPKTISLANPRDNITKAEVAAVMSDIIAKKTFITTNGDLVGIRDVKLRTVEVLS